MLKFWRFLQAAREVLLEDQEVGQVHVARARLARRPPQDDQSSRPQRPLDRAVRPGACRSSAAPLGYTVRFRTAKCSNCGRTGTLRTVFELDNLLGVAGNAILIGIDLALATIGFGGTFNPVRFRIKRQCKQCGAKFVGRSKLPPRPGVCALCGYNLTGNVSGRCPECGWRIPRHLRTGTH